MELDEHGRELLLLSTTVDPGAQAILDAVDPWKAYWAAMDISGALSDAVLWMPHGGALYIAWTELSDLYETGKTSIPDAHAALRRASNDWLAVSTNRTGPALKAWVARTEALVGKIFERDGDFWRDPGQ
jgi:hypothetical protein